MSLAPGLMHSDVLDPAKGIDVKHRIRTSNEMQVMQLTEGTVYLGLKIRYPAAGDPERYHWFIQLTGDEQSSTCVHATSSSKSLQVAA